VTKLDEKAKKLLVDEREERSWVTHSQRAEVLLLCAK
jgi:hypothetical protein